MKQNISNIKLNFSCSQNWDDMPNTNGGKFCTGCQKTVYDLTNKKAAYFLKLLTEQNHAICGRFTADQMIQEPAKEIGWKKWIVAAMVFIGFGPLMQKADAQTVQDKKSGSAPLDNERTQMFLLGEPAVFIADRETREGLNAVDTYLSKEFHGPTTLKGTLMVSFSVNKNGELYNIKASHKISDGINETVKKEVLRLLANVPKWKNYKQTNQNIAHVYSSILSFKAGKIVRTERM